MLGVFRPTLVALGVLVALVPGPARGAEVPVVTVPGSTTAGYATPVIAIRVGDGISFSNFDLWPHDVVSIQTGPKTQPWCKPEEATCPLFWTPLIGTAATASVLGLENVQAGTTYDFACTAHSWMTGVLAVLPAEAG